MDVPASIPTRHKPVDLKSKPTHCQRATTPAENRLRCIFNINIYAYFLQYRAITLTAGLFCGV